MEKLSMIAAVLLCLTTVTAQNLETFTASYGPFNSSYHCKLKLGKSAATISNGALQLTPNSAYQRGLLGKPLENQFGRVTLNHPFRLWEQSYSKNSDRFVTLDRVASFNSSFLFSVYPLGGNTTPGEGLAFLITSSSWLPRDSFGQYLGLTNVQYDGSPSNEFIAIEFDNVKQPFDPDANHVGLNINSVLSTVNASLTPWGIELAPRDEPRFYNAWVQYDGVNKIIEVYIARQAELHGETPSRPDNPILKSNLDLRKILGEYSYFGFSASTGNNVQLNCILRWNLTVDSYVNNYYTPDDPLWQKTPLVVGVSVPLLVIGVAVTGYYYLWKKRSMVQFKFKSNVLLGTLKRLPGTPREFKFKDLKKATNNFDQKKKLGQGGFGVVYRGHLQNEIWRWLIGAQYVHISAPNLFLLSPFNLLLRVQCFVCVFL